MSHTLPAASTMMKAVKGVSATLNNKGHNIAAVASSMTMTKQNVVGNNVGE